MHFTDITGLAGNALAIVTAFLLVPGVSRLSPGKLAVLLGALALTALIPFGGLPLAAYLRGAIGDLSITSLLLLLAALARPVLGRTGAKPRAILLVLIVLAALILYPLALGLGEFDPYRLGYGDGGLLGALFILALAALWRGLHAIALGLALAVAAWGVGWYESSNLWDYLIDPFVAVYAAASLVGRGVQTAWRRHRTDS